MNTIETAPEMETLKTKLKSTWEAGDYAEFAQYLEAGALEFLERLNLKPGTKVLDIACGAGQITIPMAKQGADVTAIDLAQNLVDRANERAQEAGLDISIQQGDAEALPFPDQSFDVSLSLIGSMFAPRPELVASEMARVTKPGGKMIMGNWTPEGHVGQMFKVVGKFVPPPSIFPSPLMWGIPEKVVERFGDTVSNLEITRHLYPFRYPFGPLEVADFFIKYYGPTFMANRALEGDAREAFRQEFAEVWTRNNEATDGTTAVNAAYLQIIGTRK